MKTFEITPLHVHGGLYNGRIFFLLNKRLLSMSFGTPAFNDYNAWKLEDIKFAKDEYVMEEDLSPLPMKPFTITEDELTMIETVFIEKDFNNRDDLINPWVAEVEALETQFADCVHPLRYLDDTALLSIETTEGLQHVTFEANEKGSDEWNDWVSYETMERPMQGEWVNKPSLLHHQGFYNFLIPVMEAMSEHYNLSNKSNDVFL